MELLLSRWSETAVVFQVFRFQRLEVANPPGAFNTSAHLSLCLSPSPSGVHVFGLLATALVTDVIQLATGYHAPFFLTVCQPNYTAPGVSCDNNAYITQDICMGKDQYAIMSARWDAHAWFPGEFRLHLEDLQRSQMLSVMFRVGALLSGNVQPVSVAMSPAYEGCDC